MDHLEHIKKTNPPQPCTASHITFGGKCLNCGWEPKQERYRILRFFSDGRPAKRIKVVSSLAIAQLHCNDPLTKGTLRSGVKWFDGYRKIGG